MEAELEKLKEGVSSLESMIMMSRAPNLKALEKIREVKDSFREVMDGKGQIYASFISGCGLLLKLKTEVGSPRL